MKFEEKNGEFDPVCNYFSGVDDQSIMKRASLITRSDNGQVSD